MSSNQARFVGIGFFAGTALVGLIVAALFFALYQISPVLFAIILFLAGFAFWFFVIEPMGRSITRDVVNHMHETDD